MVSEICECGGSANWGSVTFCCIGHPVTQLSGGGSLVGVAVNSQVMRRDVDTQVPGTSICQCLNKVVM